MVVDILATDRADLVFAALSDRTRRDILSLVLVGEYSVSRLARRFPMSFAAVQKHVVVLERAGLVVKRRAGREQRVTGNPDGLRDAQHLLTELEGLWRHRIERIGDILAEPEEGITP
jgi:DNA-binding transcriptional ArsR family regulator